MTGDLSMKNEIYGIKFRKLRKQQHLSLKKVAEGITSRQTLGNWELGKGEMDFTKVLLLLRKIHVQPIDFLENSVSEYLRQITSEISGMYVNDQTDSLHQYAQHALNVSHDNVKDKIVFFRACVACNYLLDSTGNDLMNKSDKLRLNSYFNKIQNEDENWHYEDVYFFGNTQSVLTARKIYELAYSLSYYAKEHSTQNKEWTTAVLNTLINALFVLIKKDIGLAQKLDSILSENLKQISDGYSFEKIRFNFMHSLIEYIFTKDNAKILRQFDFLQFENLANLESGFRTAYKQVERIYFG